MMRKVCTKYEENVGIHADLKYSVQRWISGIGNNNNKTTVQTKAFLAHCKKQTKIKPLLKFRNYIMSFFQLGFCKAREPENCNTPDHISPSISDETLSPFPDI